MSQVPVKRHQKTVLIASCSLDELLIRPVAEALTRQGYRVTTYEADKVASGEKPLTVQVNEGRLTVCYDQEHFELSEVGAAWLRRPNVFGPIQEDKAKQLCLDKERRQHQDMLWGMVPERAWLNAPGSIQRADNKLVQLVLAHSIGFATPHTTVSNQWEDIIHLPSERIAVKMIYGILYEQNKIKALYTTTFDRKDTLPLDGNPFPGIWQPYISKGREWRITAVGNETFDVAIYTGTRAKDDWRQHQDGSEVEFRCEKFPDEAKAQCLHFLSQLGLRYGAFDFIEEPDGRLIFLELNPNGQYGWLEEKLGLPISEAITSELAAIANAS